MSTFTSKPRWVTGPTAEAVLTRHGAAGRVWLENIDAVITELCIQWELTPHTPLGGGKYSAVVAATTHDGNEVVVKVAPDPTATTLEKATYQAWNATGTGACPSVLHHDPHTGALCIERLHPGSPLPTQQHLDDFELELLDRVLHTTRTGVAYLQATHRSMDTWLDIRHRQLQKRVQQLELADASAINAAADAARRALSHRQGATALCHGDLHQGNLIANGDAYFLIDPVGIIGPTECDAAFFAVTRGGGHGVPQRIDSYSEHLELDEVLLAACCVFIAADRLVIEHWYQNDPSLIEPLTNIVSSHTELLR